MKKYLFRAIAVSSFAFFIFGFTPHYAFATHTCTGDPSLDASNDALQGHACTASGNGSNNRVPPIVPGQSPIPGANGSPGDVVVQPPGQSSVSGKFADLVAIGAQDFINVITEIRNFLMVTGIVLVVIIFIWAGVSFLTSQGEPEKLAAAKQRFTWAVIGTFILLGTFIIIQTILTILNQRSLFTSTT